MVLENNEDLLKRCQKLLSLKRSSLDIRLLIFNLFKPLSIQTIAREQKGWLVSNANSHLHLRLLQKKKFCQLTIAKQIRYRSNEYNATTSFVSLFSSDLLRLTLLCDRTYPL